MRPAEMLSARASKLEPRPLKSTPMRFFIWSGRVRNYEPKPEEKTLAQVLVLPKFGGQFRGPNRIFTTKRNRVSKAAANAYAARWPRRSHCTRREEPAAARVHRGRWADCP